MRGFRIIALVLLGMINVVETAQIGAKYAPEFRVCRTVEVNPEESAGGYLSRASPAPLG